MTVTLERLRIAFDSIWANYEAARIACVAADKAVLDAKLVGTALDVAKAFEVRRAARATYAAARTRYEGALDALYRL
jgi:hypothetical protein